MKKLFLLDAYALIFRSYYAFINNPRYNSKGVNTSAIFGFTNTLDEVLRKEAPTHIAVVFDPPPPTFRHKMFDQYKANRQATPEDIRKAVPYIKRIIDGYNIPIIQVDGFEADDVIGTLAKKFEKEGFTVYMMTPDKDYSQLVSDHIFVYKPRTNGNSADILGKPEVKRDFLVDQPELVADILALWGDASDNIPGAPGIGEKTAKKLVSEFGSVENIIANVQKLKGKQKDIILNNQEVIALSKKLTSIVLDVPVEISEKELEKVNMDRVKLQEIFDELEFKNLANRILNSGMAAKASVIQGSLFPEETPQELTASVASSLKTIKDIEHSYSLVNEKAEREKLIGLLQGQKEFCFDTETTGLDPHSAELVGISFCFQAHQAWYLPVPGNREAALNLLKEFKALFEDEKIRKVGQNIKFDILMLKGYGIEVKGEIFDTMIAHYLIQPELRHNMNYLSEIYLHYDPVHIESLIGKAGKDQISMRLVPVETIKEYCCEDSDVTIQLKEILEKELNEKGFIELAEKVEFPLINTLAQMEWNGMKLDVTSLSNYGVALEKEVAEIERDIYQLAGEEFNISSPKQLGEILFEKLAIVTDAKKTKTKQYSTGEEVIQKLKDKHPIVEKVLQYRGLKKLISTYVDALPKLVNPKTKRIHTSFNQAITATGRLSSTNPNLQNIPIRDEEGKEIRKAFIASDDQHVLLSADYSQIELRVMAHICSDEHLIEAFRKNEDVHTLTASKIFNVPIESVSADMRRKAKTANFGIIYGISAFGLSERLNIPRAEAKALIEGYFENFPEVKKYMNRVIDSARDKGYVETILGRKRFLKDIHSANAVVRGVAERNAINAPVQGSAADIIKIAMVNIQKKLNERRLQSLLILQVHDELVLDIFKPELEEVRELVKTEMESAVELKVPLLVEIGAGQNWLEAH